MNESKRGVAPRKRLLDSHPALDGGRIEQLELGTYSHLSHISLLLRREFHEGRRESRHDANLKRSQKL